MMKIGITGGIGSGKTTVCRVFQVLGIPVFYADDLLVQAFRTVSISSIVFRDKDQLAKLNALVHPAVFRAFDSWAQAQKDVPYVLKEAALLFESDSYKMCDQTILVISPEALKINRIIKRDNITAEEVRLRMDRQFSDEQKEKLADHIITNDERTLVIPQILTLHQYFINLSHDS